MPAARVWRLGKSVVLADGIEPFWEPFALALGEHVGERPDVTGQGLKFGAVGQDGLEPELFDLGGGSGRLRIHVVTTRGAGGCDRTG